MEKGEVLSPPFFDFEDQGFLPPDDLHSLIQL
jgi:hypothetical protein